MLECLDLCSSSILNSSFLIMCTLGGSSQILGSLSPVLDTGVEFQTSGFDLTQPWFQQMKDSLSLSPPPHFLFVNLL